MTAKKPKKPSTGDCAVQDLRIGNLEDDMDEIQTKVNQTRAMGASASKRLDKWVDRGVGVAFALSCMCCGLTLMLTLQRLGYIPPPPAQAVAPVVATRVPAGAR